MANNVIENYLDINTDSPGIPSNDYDEIIDNIDEEKTRGIKQSLYSGSLDNPEKKRKAYKLSKDIDVPTNVVEEFPEEAERKRLLKNSNYREIVSKDPGISKWLGKPGNSSLAIDDLKPLSTISRGSTSLIKITPQTSFTSELFQATKSGAHQLHSSMYHIAAAYGNMSLKEAAESQAAAHRRYLELQAKKPDYSKEFDKMLQEETGDITKAWKRFIGSFHKIASDERRGALKDYYVGGAMTILETLDFIYESAIKRPKGTVHFTTEQLANTFPIIAGSALGTGGGALAGSAIPGVGTAVGGIIGGFTGAFTTGSLVEIGGSISEQLAERGVDLSDPIAVENAYRDPEFLSEIRSAAERKGLTTAGIDAIFHAFGLGLATKAARTGKAISTVKRVGKEVAIETVGETVGEAGGQLAQHKGDLMQVDLGQSIAEGLAGLTQSSGQVAVSESFGAIQARRKSYSSDPVDAAEEIALDTKKALEASHDAKKLEEITNAVDESKLSKELPDKVSELVQDAVGDESDGIYFQLDDWDSYWTEQGKSPAKAAAQLIRDNGKSYHEAKSNGTALEIPFKDYISKVMTDVEQANELNRLGRVGDAHGLNFIEAQEHLQSLPELFNQVAKESQDIEKTDIETQTEQIRDVIGTELEAVNLPPEAADVVSSFIRTRAVESGKVSPREIYSQFPLLIEKAKTSVPMFQMDEDVTTFARRGETPQDTVQIPKTIKINKLAKHKTIKNIKDPKKLSEEVLAITPRGAFKNKHSGIDINISNDTIKKSINQAKKISKPDRKVFREHLEASQYLKELVENAVFLTEKEDTKNKDINWKNFFAPFEMNGEKYYAKLQVKETIEGHTLHNYAVVNASRSVPGYTATTAATAKDARRLPTDEMTIDDFGKDINALRNFPYFQRPTGRKPPKGMIEFFDEKALITVFEAADIGTVFHESGHYMLEFLSRFTESNLASDRDKRDFQTTLNWFEQQDHEKSFEALEKLKNSISDKEKKKLVSDAIQYAKDHGGANFLKGVAKSYGKNVKDPRFKTILLTPYHELWAESFRDYVFEGKAPSNALKAAFFSFKKWFLLLFNKAKEVANIQPEIRDIFERMLATEEEIHQVKNDIDPNPITSETLGLKGEEAERFDAAQEDFSSKASQDLIDKLISQRDRKKKKYWINQKNRLKKVIEQQVNRRPDQIAASLILEGKLPDGTPFNETPLKLSRGAVSELKGKDFVKRFPSRFLVTEEGYHPDMVADHAGFSSADEMLNELAVYQPKDVLIDRLADAEMRNLYGDMTTDGTLSDEAMKSLHSDKRSEFLRLQLKYMARDHLPALKQGIKRLSGMLASDKALKEYARKTVSSQLVKNIKPLTYLKAEKKAAKEAGILFSRGDQVGAFESKQKQLMNHELYRAAINAREDITKSLKYINNFKRREKQAQIGKAGNSYLEQIEALLIRFDFRKGVTLKQLERRKNLREFIKTFEGQGLVPPIPEKILNEADKISYKEIPHSELMEVRDSIKAIEHLAGLKNRLIKVQKERTFDEVVEKSTEIITTNAKRVIKQQRETGGKMERAKSTVRGFFAMNRVYREIISEMEGFEHGFLHETATAPLNEAGANEELRKIVEREKLNTIFEEAYTKKEQAKMYIKEHIPEINDSLSRWGMITALLNWGTRDSRTKLMAGEKWNEFQVQAILNRLDKKDFDFAQSVWNYLDGYKKEIIEMSKRVDGIAPKMLEPSKIVTPHGVYEGGYYPLKYDHNRDESSNAELAKEQIEAAKRGASIRATTRHGFRKERVEGVVRPVRLDISVLFEHVDEVIHDLTHYETILDLNKLFRDKRMEQTIKRHYGVELYRELTNTLVDVATGDRIAQNTIQKVLNYLRNGTTVSVLGWSVTTISLQPLGLVPAFQKVGVKWVAKGVGRWLGTPTRMQETAEWITEKSVFMRTRQRTINREIRDVYKDIGRQFIPKEILESNFYLLTKVQYGFADIPVWLGAYEKQMDKDPMNEKRAVQLADQAVIDTQGDGKIVNLARMQRGGAFLKLFTNFLSYGNTMLQRNIEIFKRTNFFSPLEVGRYMADFMLINILPATLGYLLREAIRGRTDWDDDELGKEILEENLGYLSQQMILLREFGGALQGFYGYSGPAGTKFFAEGSALTRQLIQGEADEAAIKALNRTGGILFHYPALQIERTIFGIDALRTGKTKNPMSILGGPPRKK